MARSDQHWSTQAVCAQPPLRDLITADLPPATLALRDRLVIEAGCQHCPVRDACLTDDLTSTTPDRWFVRGGHTAMERRRMRAADTTEVAP